MQVWLAGLAALLCQAQDALPPELLLLAKIKVKMAENLERLPNYTCAQTIERSRRLAPTKKFQLVDTVHLEVAYVEGKELFGWPGADKIDESEITKLVGGTIGNGNFALLAKSIFLAGSATYTYVGDTALDGRPGVRYDYRVPLLLSGYRLKSPPREAVVGYHGSFWVAPDSLDLLRIEVTADDIPVSLGIAAAADTMEYGRVAIGNSTFLLPQGSELEMTDLGGTENKNRTRFHACRQFTGESTLSFGEPPPEGPAKQQIAAIALPEDFSADITLETAIDSTSSAIGDPVKAILRQSIKAHRDVLVPKGAELSGRIARMERRGNYYLLDLAFTALDFEGGHADLAGRENEVSMLVSSHTLQPGLGTRAPEYAVTSSLASISLQTDHLRLPRGARLSLRSRLVESKGNDSIRP